MNKLIFISNSLADLENVKHFARKNSYSLAYYSKEEWKNRNRKFEKKNALENNSLNAVSYNLSVVQLPNTNHSLQTLDEIKGGAIKTALLQAKGNASKAAEILQIGRATLYRKIKKLDINLEYIRKDLNEQGQQDLSFKKTA